MNVSTLPEMKFIQRFIQNNRPLEIALLSKVKNIYKRLFGANKQSRLLH